MLGERQGADALAGGGENGVAEAGRTGGSGSVTKGPPPQNFTVTVTAASGAIQHSTNVAVTVQ